MDDEKIKDIFRDFKPELSSDFQFMSRLEQNLNAVEIARQQNSDLRRQCRRAVVLASICGIVAGLILGLFMPVATDWISTARISVPFISINSIRIDYTLIAWILSAGVSVIVALNAYEIAMARAKQKAPARPASSVS